MINYRKEMIKVGVRLAQSTGRIDMAAVAELMAENADRGIMAIFDSLHGYIIELKNDLVRANNTAKNDLAAINAVTETINKVAEENNELSNQIQGLNKRIVADEVTVKLLREELKAVKQELASKKTLYIRYYKNNAREDIRGTERELFRCDMNDLGFWERRDNGEYWATEIDGSVACFEETDPDDFGEVYFR
jgi:hypothetical protein